MGYGRTWTDEEDQYLRDNLHKLSNFQLAEGLGIPKYSVIGRLGRLKLTRRKTAEYREGEIWKEIDYAPGYSVSDQGRIRNDKTMREMKQNIDDKGYYATTLMIGGIATPLEVHRVMMLAFKPHPQAHLMTVNHIDTIKLNNDLNNFEWLTRVDNIKHAWENGLCEGRVGSNSHFATVPEETVRAICKMIADKKTNQQITTHFKLSNKDYVSSIRCRKKWKHISSEYF